LNSFAEEFRGAAREAREQGRGLWAEEPADEDDDVPAASVGAGERRLHPADQCCRICSTGKAYGKSCISASSTCHKGRGCACNAEEVCR